VEISKKGTSDTVQCPLSSPQTTTVYSLADLVTWPPSPRLWAILQLLREGCPYTNIHYGSNGTGTGVIF